MDPLLFFRREGGRIAPDSASRPDARGLRIRCPRCRWQPTREDRWSCLCLHFWNTFDTGGVCPACGRAWQETQCLRCHEWSPHAEWYAEEAE